MSRYTGGSSGGGGTRRPAPSYQTSSSSRNYSSTGSSDREYSRSHLSGNGGSSSSYYSSSTSRKPESGTTGYSYLEPNWIEKTRSSLPVDPYSSSYLDRTHLSTSRDYTTPAAAQPVYPSAAAAALSVGAYGTNSSMPKAYARADEYYRGSASALPSTAAYGYGSAFEQSTMAAQAAAIYEMQNTKRETWPASSHPVEYGRREEDRRGERRRDEGRREDRRGTATESWRNKEREVARDGTRRPVVPSRERDKDSDLRVTVSSRRDDHREVRRSESTATARGGRHGQSRDVDVRDARDARDVSRRSNDKRAVVNSKLDRESRDLERQLAKVQRELEQLESAGRGKGGSRERESDRTRRSLVSTAVRRPSPPPRGRGKPPPPRRETAVPSSRSGFSLSSSYRTATVRPSRLIRPLGGRARSSAALPSLMDKLVPRPGRRPALSTSRVSRVSAWEAPGRRGVGLTRPPVASRIAGYAAKRTTRGRGDGLSSREKVKRAKDKMRREEERRKRMETRKEAREDRSKESREKRKEEDFAWLETIMSEDEELDEEANRKVLLAPRRRRVMAIVDTNAVHPHTMDNLRAKRDVDAVMERDELWTAEECEAIELLPLIDPVQSLKLEVFTSFLAAHPHTVTHKTPDSNGNGVKMEE